MSFYGYPLIFEGDEKEDEKLLGSSLNPRLLGICITVIMGLTLQGMECGRASLRIHLIINVIAEWCISEDS